LPNFGPVLVVAVAGVAWVTAGTVGVACNFEGWDDELLKKKNYFCCERTQTNMVKQFSIHFVFKRWAKYFMRADIPCDYDLRSSENPFDNSPQSSFFYQ
jgi:hypothetical protein